MRFLIICCLFVLVGNATAQVVNSASKFLSANPATMLQTAAATNGVDLDPSTPWHAKLHYEVYDEDGDKVQSGTFEEYYVNAHKYRQAYVGGAFEQTDVADDTGLYRSGNPDWIGPTELQIKNEVLQPLYRTSLVRQNTKLDTTDWTVGTITLSCVVIQHTDMVISVGGLHKFCFDPGTNHLRYTKGQAWDETSYNNLVTFQNRTVARDVTVHHGGKAELKIHVDVLESIASPDMALFVPPPGNALVAGRLKMSSSILSDEYLISKVNPDGGGAKGVVHVHFLVGKDGRVIEADALDGPKDLQKNVLSATRKWKFRPVLVLGTPIEVESNMDYSFQ